jgi:glycosyltransferase involved in cell wall biosynthesis
MRDTSSRLRILHVWNTAGVGSVIAKFMDRKYGTDSLVITRKAADPVGITTYGKTLASGPWLFSGRALMMARKFDIIHVHSLEGIVPWMKRIYMEKPVVLHYHGGEIRDRWEEKRKTWKQADFVAYATPDMGEGAPEGIDWAPNPVDTDIFRSDSSVRQEGTAVSIRYNMDDEAEGFAQRNGLKLSWIERKMVPHDEMPRLLQKSEYYLDFRRRLVDGKIVRCLGKAGLEALACGCKVADWTGELHEGLPPVHLPDAVAERWHGIYERILEE